MKESVAEHLMKEGARGRGDKPFSLLYVRCTRRVLGNKPREAKKRNVVTLEEIEYLDLREGLDGEERRLTKTASARNMPGRSSASGPRPAPCFRDLLARRAAENVTGRGRWSSWG